MPAPETADQIQEKVKEESTVEMKMSADGIAALLAQSSDGDPFDIQQDDNCQSSSPSIIFGDNN